MTLNLATSNALGAAPGPGNKRFATLTFEREVSRAIGRAVAGLDCPCRARGLGRAKSIGHGGVPGSRYQGGRTRDFALQGRGSTGHQMREWLARAAAGPCAASTTR